MITVNTYVIAERAVYEGVALAVSKMTQTKATKPENVVDEIAAAVMKELCDTFDFGIQPVRFTNELMQKMWAEAHAQTVTEAEKTEVKEGA